MAAELKLIPKLDSQSRNAFKVSPVARDQRSPVHHADRRDSQIVGGDANALLPPLLIGSFRVTGVRKDLKPSQLADGFFKKLIREVGGYL